MEKNQNNVTIFMAKINIANSTTIKNFILISYWKRVGEGQWI